MSHDSETRSLTYDDLAAALGIRLDSARQRVARRRWRRVRGNDGRVLIQVPVEALPRLEPPHEAGSEPPHDAGTEPPRSKGDTGGEPPQFDAPDRDELNRTIGRLEAERATAEAVLAECRLALSASERHVAEARERAEQEAVRSARLAVEAAAAEILRETVEALKGALQAERELRAAESSLRSVPPVRVPWWRRLSLAGASGR